MKKILVVDDDNTYAYLLERQLRNVDKSVSVKTCASGKEALDYLMSSDEQPPDVLMLDLNMPIMNGFEFLEAFERLCRKKNVDVPPPMIWIVTSSDIDSDKQKAERFHSARGYLVKPVGRKEIEGLLLS